MEKPQVKSIEKRLRQALRETLTENDQDLLIANDGTAEGAVLEYFLTTMLEKTGKKMEVVGSREQTVEGTQEYDKIFLPISQEAYAAEKLDELFKTGQLEERKASFLLRGISTAEAEHYANTKGLPYTKKEKKKHLVALEQLEKKKTRKHTRTCQSAKGIRITKTRAWCFALIPDLKVGDFKLKNMREFSESEILRTKVTEY